VVFHISLTTKTPVSWLLPGDADVFVMRLTLLWDMEKIAPAEAERWGLEAVTSDLRNTKYKQALHNTTSVLV